MTGSNERYIYTGKYSRRKKCACECTALEAAEIELLFGFYREEMKRELEVFMVAFIQKNNIFQDKTARCYKENDGSEQELTEEERCKYKKAAFMRMIMDGRKPPKAAIEAREE